MLRYIFGVILVVQAGWIILLATGWELPYVYSVKLIQWLRIHPWQSLVYALFIFFVGMYLLPKHKPKEKKFFAKTIETGELRITQEAIEDIIQHSISGIGGLKRSRSSIRHTSEGLEIFVYCWLEASYELPNISLKIQEKIRQDIERYSEIKIKEVRVLKR